MRRLLPLLLVLLPLAVPAQTVRSFTDADYRKVLKDQSRVLFYSVSTNMDLSVQGVKEARKAADDVHAQLVLLADPAISPQDVASLGDAQIQYQKSAELRTLGLQLHYPSVVVADRNKVVGAPIAGYKTRAGYVRLISDRLKLNWREEFQVTDRIALPRRMNEFFRPIYGTDLIVSGSSTPNYLFDLKTKQTFDIPGYWGDPGASSDGQFVTVLSGGAGLSWSSVADILVGKAQTLLVDPGLRTYQSMAQLSPTTYRVLGAISSSTNPAGLIVRDYEKRERPDGGVTVVPFGEWWRKICEGQTIAIPMMSKSGLYLSGSYDGTIKVFRIGKNADECTEVFESKAVAGKADFSMDDRYITYVVQSLNPKTNATVDTVFLADLKGGPPAPIYFASDYQRLAFPGFVDSDRIVVYEVPDKLVLLERIRVIEK